MSGARRRAVGVTTIGPPGANSASNHASSSGHVAGLSRSGDPEALADVPCFPPEGLAVFGAKWRHPGVICTHGADDERGLYPEQQSRVQGAVADGAAGLDSHWVHDVPTNGGMDVVQALDRSLGLSGVAEDHREGGAQGAAQSPERIGREVAVRGDPFGDERMGDLEEQRRRPGPEQDGLAVDAPHPAARAVEAQHRVAGGTNHGLAG